MDHGQWNSSGERQSTQGQKNGKHDRNVALTVENRIRLLAMGTQKLTLQGKGKSSGVR
jgi:hypothetical protein